jgi:hypothetical protein
MSLSEFEAVTTLFGGPDHFQAIKQLENVRAFDRLPRNRKGYPNDDVAEAESRAIAERLGFVFGEVIDEKFVEVTAPEGWGLRRTDHGMYSDIVDNLGRVRGSQFFKAAAYDYEAFYHFSPRYRLHETKPEDWFQRSHPRQPEPLFETKEQRVLVSPDGEELEVLDGPGKKRGKRANREAGRPFLDQYDRGDHEHWPKHGPRRDPRGEGLPARRSAAGADRGAWLRLLLGCPRQRDRRDRLERRDLLPPTREENPTYFRQVEEDGEKGRVAASAWLDEHFPDWRDPVAYWSAP